MNAHGTSTPAGDLAEYRAIARALTHKDVRINSTKSMIGHLMGAAGAVEAVAAVQAIRTGFVHPNLNLDDPDPDVNLDIVVGSTKLQHKARRGSAGAPCVVLAAPPALAVSLGSVDSAPSRLSDELPPRLLCARWTSRSPTRSASAGTTRASSSGRLRPRHPRGADGLGRCLWMELAPGAGEDCTFYNRPSSRHHSTRRAPLLWDGARRGGAGCCRCCGRRDLSAARAKGTSSCCVAAVLGGVGS